jgi:hypothetical protein
MRVISSIDNNLSIELGFVKPLVFVYNSSQMLVLFIVEFVFLIFLTTTTYPHHPDTLLDHTTARVLDQRCWLVVAVVGKGLTYCAYVFC